MPNLLENFYANVIFNKEHFREDTVENNSIMKLLPTLLAIITVDILLLIFGKYLWNTYLVPSTSLVSPIKSIIDLLAIKILLRLLLN
tara:strand:- start:141 stop:401 length:261 start_codon:yes stop_codon:yes gene_type:complete